ADPRPRRKPRGMEILDRLERSGRLHHPVPVHPRPALGPVRHAGARLMQGYILNLLILVSISGILATSLNFIIGYAGIYSMAHAAFFGVAAYAGALVAMHVSSSLLVTIPVAMVVCAALSLVISLPSLRVRGDYFVVASLG